MATDPICGMGVDEETARFKAESGGKTYYFCSPGCMKAFNANPTKYAK
ncbi:MAG: YHS domain-containing protein [Nitrososphaerales archaeon]|nr:YHS domain-containing protein [Nitrososphaerales archaeon]